MMRGVVSLLTGVLNPRCGRCARILLMRTCNERSCRNMPPAFALQAIDLELDASPERLIYLGSAMTHRPIPTQVQASI